MSLGRSPSAAVVQANAAKEDDDEMADGLTMEAVQTEAAARQRAFESQEANTSTSGRGAAIGMQMTSQFHCRAADTSKASHNLRLLAGLMQLLDHIIQRISTSADAVDRCMPLGWR